MNRYKNCNKFGYYSPRRFCVGCFITTETTRRDEEKGLLRCLLPQLSSAPSITFNSPMRLKIFVVISSGSSKVDLLKLIFNGRHQRRKLTVQGVERFFDYAARFTFQKEESCHRPILLFLTFIRFSGTTIRGQGNTTNVIWLKL